MPNHRSQQDSSEYKNNDMSNVYLHREPYFTINLPDKQKHHHHHHHQDVVSSTSQITCSSSSSSAVSTTSSKDFEHHHHDHYHDNHTDTHQINNNNQEPKSIDSLHGLRFLSMIWIIVIHSYNFALRWSFFSNSSSLDNLYKNSASQLLANGTFACDSFLFIGGFLLPYLAFPEQATGGAAGASGAPTSPSDAPNSPKTTSSGCLSSGDKFSSETKLKCSSLSSSCCRLETNDKDSLFIMYKNQFTFKRVLLNLLHRYIRMMPLMMAIIALSSTLLRYLGTGQQWDDSTVMFDKWCRDNWWINLFFLHNFIHRENMCLSHSWYSAVDIQLFFFGQLILFTLFRSKKFGLFLIFMFLFMAQMITGILTVVHNLPAVPLISSVSEQSENLYYGEIYIKPYCRASPYLIGILLAYLMRTTSLGQVRLSKLQAATGWTISLGTIYVILMAMQPAMNGQQLSQIQSALYSALSRPLWACATGWMIFACMTKNGFFFQQILGAKAFIPLSRLTYPAFLIHPIVIAISYGSRQSNFQFSHYLMLYLILGNIVITYASAFLLSILFELPFLTAEKAIRRAWSSSAYSSSSGSSSLSVSSSNTSSTTKTTTPIIRLSTPN